MEQEHIIHTDEVTDEVLIERIRGGEADLFGIIMQRYEPKLTRYGRKFLVRAEHIEDVVQDVFIKTYQHLYSYDISRAFSPWIYRIAHNLFINEIKKSRTRPQLLPDFDLLVSHTVYEDPAEGERERADIRKELESCLSILSDNYREILLLRYYENMDYKDIADVLQVPLGTVSVRIQRAKLALKKHYDTLNNPL